MGSTFVHRPRSPCSTAISRPGTFTLTLFHLQRTFDLFPKTSRRPPSILLIHRHPFPILFRQVTPRFTGSLDPKNSVESPAIANGFTTVRRPHLPQEWFIKLPFFIRHQITLIFDLLDFYVAPQSEALSVSFRVRQDIFPALLRAILDANTCAMENSTEYGSSKPCS